ncbi:hypothetical protein Y032_0105g3669 [Ancylostoma ceylanicum]|uniref:Uncharacterized protein n=1 Tax=Ancylostoma ceylanicum TaxID=53326 RepID=A0A016TG63_9BILA|nr:hypothetical protein Y032_0105g3669 [Ancylostoma ceylanicum]
MAFSSVFSRLDQSVPDLPGLFHQIPEARYSSRSYGCVNNADRNFAAANSEYCKLGPVVKYHGGEIVCLHISSPHVRQRSHTRQLRSTWDGKSSLSAALLRACMCEALISSPWSAIIARSWRLDSVWCGETPSEVLGASHSEYGDGVKLREVRCVNCTDCI